MRELNGGASHCSHSTSILHFGLGTTEMVDSIVIHWTGNAHQQTIYAIPANRRILVTEAEPEFTTNTKTITETTAIQLFPNPSQDWLTIKLPNFEHQPATISILTATGQTLLVTTTNQSLLTLPIKDFSTGIYFVKVEIANAVELRKFVRR